MVKLTIEDNNHPTVEMFLRASFEDLLDIIDGKIVAVTMRTQETEAPFREIEHIFTSSSEIKLTGDYLHIKSVLTDSVIDLKHEQPFEVIR